MPSLTSPVYAQLVKALQKQKAVVSVVESCCGGTISASIMAQAGSSRVYWGGSVAYNTAKAKPFLLNDETLHQTLLHPPKAVLPNKNDGTNRSTKSSSSEKDAYIQSKVHWTRETALAFCRETGTDFCIAEAGAAGPTFRPADLHTGFAVVAVAARNPSTGAVELVQQQIVESASADRQGNMRWFADQAAALALTAVLQLHGSDTEDPPLPLSLPPLAAADSAKLNVPLLDRATHMRTDSVALAALAPAALYLVLHKNLALFGNVPDSGTSNGNNSVSQDRRLAFLPLDQVERVCATTGAKKQTTFLGLLDGQQAVFGVDLLLQDNESATTIQQAIHNVQQGNDFEDRATVFQDTRTVAPLLSPATADNELVLHATALAQWQRRAPFCPACGGATTLLDGGTSRKCTACSQQSWPRQDPSMIAVVSSRDGQRVLLARSKRHPERMHTALAGFVEAGETMERAVAREVYEETGIRIDLDSVNYVATQPWPFPQSTMIGFTVTADETQPLNIDMNELVSAEWFDRAQVQVATTVPGAVMQHEVAAAAIAANPRLELLIPPKGVLARTLLETWLRK